MENPIKKFNKWYNEKVAGTWWEFAWACIAMAIVFSGPLIVMLGVLLNGY